MWISTKIKKTKNQNGPYRDGTRSEAKTLITAAVVSNYEKILATKWSPLKWNISNSRLCLENGSQYTKNRVGRKFTGEQIRRSGTLSNPNERRASRTIGKCTSTKHGTLNRCQAMRLGESGVVKQSAEWSGNGKARKRGTLYRFRNFSSPAKRTRNANEHIMRELHNACLEHVFFFRSIYCVISLVRIVM